MSGSTPKTNIAEFWDGDVKWITPAELDENTYIITDSVRKITDLAMQKTGLTAFPAGTVILSSRAPIGKVAIAGCKMCCNQGFKNFICSELVNNKYLYWFLKHNTAYLNSLGRGATFKEISKSIVSSIEINLPSLEEQQRVVDNIEKISTIITLRKKEISILDDLIKARFVEMFGNPLDKSKANMYFVECVEFNPKKSEVKDLMCETVSFVPMECVGADGSFKIKEDGLVKDYYKGYTYFKNGDVLLAKITPCFENGKVAIVENCTNGIGFGTTEFHVSRPIPGVSNSQWIKYMLKNEHVHELATINMTGSAGQKRIQTPFFEKLKVYLPPIELQNQFADFVAQIDKSKLLSGCRLFHSWAPENRDKPKHVGGVPRRKTKVLRGRSTPTCSSPS